MNTKRQFVRVFHVVVVIVLIIQLSACGYFMYPERRGQKPVGRIDPAIAVLDALGLLLFIIPGVIAFAVDITNGTLYFPGGQRHSSVSGESCRMTMLRVNPTELNEKMIQQIVEKQTGISLSPDLSKAEIYPLDRSENIEATLGKLERSGYREDWN